MSAKWNTPGSSLHDFIIVCSILWSFSVPIQKLLELTLSINLHIFMGNFVLMPSFLCNAWKSCFADRCNKCKLIKLLRSFCLFFPLSMCVINEYLHIVCKQLFGFGKIDWFSSCGYKNKVVEKLMRFCG